MRRLLVVMMAAAALGAEAEEANWPDGHALVYSLERPDKPGVNRIKAPIIRGTGIVYVLPASEDTAYPMLASRKNAVFHVEAPDQDGAYVFGFDWWDADGQGRRQSVAFRALGSDEWVEVLPPTVPAAFHGDERTWARALLPVPDAMARAGGFKVRIKNEGGWDVVLGKVWLLKRVEKKAKRLLIVTGDDYKGHLWRETGPELAEILREDSRLEVTITEAPAMLGSPLLKHYDAVVIHFKNYAERLPLGEEVWAGLRAYVAQGGGVVTAHFGCGAFQEWEDFVDVIGRVWNPALRGHDKYGAFGVRIADGAHAVTRGMADFETEDELYTCLAGETDIHVLCDAVSKVDGKTYPMAFVVEGGGKVFTCTLGHDVNSLQPEGTRALYRRAAAWAAGLSAAP